MNVKCASTCALGIVYTMDDGTAWHADLAGEKRPICPERKWCAVACSSNGIATLVFHDRFSVHVHDMNTGTGIDILGVYAGWDPAIAVSGDGTQFAVTGNEDVIDIWDIGSKQCVRRIEDARASALKWNPTRPLLLTDARDIRGDLLWDVHMPVYNTQTGAAYHLPYHDGYEWSADGSRITIKDWIEVVIRDADNGEIVSALSGAHTRGRIMCPLRPDLAAWFYPSRDYHDPIQVWAVSGTKLKLIVNHTCKDGAKAMVWGKVPNTIVYLTNRGEVVTIGWGESRRRVRVSTCNAFPMVDNPEALLRGRKRRGATALST